MITDTEYVIIKSFDKTLAENTRHAQGIIDRKNALLRHADVLVVQLQRELEIERGKRKLAEFKLMRLRRH